MAAETGDERRLHVTPGIGKDFDCDTPEVKAVWECVSLHEPARVCIHRYVFGWRGTASKRGNSALVSLAWSLVKLYTCGQR